MPVNRAISVSGGLATQFGQRVGYIRLHQLFAYAVTIPHVLPAARVGRCRGFEPEQIEQMILQYVRAHGRITRREVAELCRVKPLQATYILKKLVRDNKLAPHGQRRGTYYT